MKNIAIQCSNNKAQHSHVFGVCEELSKHESVKLQILYFDKAHLGIFETFEKNSKISFVNINDNCYSIGDFFIERYFGFLKKIKNKLFGNRNYFEHKYCYLNNSKLIKKLDCIVFTDSITGCTVKRINPKIKVVWTLHGPSLNDNFPRGKAPTNVDLILSPGKTSSFAFRNAESKVIQIGPVKLENHSLINKERLFLNENTTVLYNPHFNEEIGANSWKNFGLSLLEFFKNNKNYNLIFAPHPNLKLAYDLSVVDEFKSESNILIDLSSEKLINLYYEPYTDLYVGDNSSQMYEYVYLRRRKVINLSKVDKEHTGLSNLAQVLQMQKLGTVLRDMEYFEAELLKIMTSQEYSLQDEIVNNVFDLSVVSPRRDAAIEICKL